MLDATSIKRQQLKMKRYDVAINGCGPVGAMLSLLLAKGGLKVLVVEKELKVFNKPRAIVLDSVVRLIPGVISNESSALFDSFQDNLLAHPIYSRPALYKNLQVPDVLLSGDTKKIDEWKEKQIIKVTKNKRHDLLD